MQEGSFHFDKDFVGDWYLIAHTSTVHTYENLSSQKFSVLGAVATYQMSENSYS